MIFNSWGFFNYISENMTLILTCLKILSGHFLLFWTNRIIRTNRFLGFFLTITCLNIVSCQLAHTPGTAVSILVNVCSKYQDIWALSFVFTHAIVIACVDLAFGTTNIFTVCEVPVQPTNRRWRWISNLKYKWCRIIYCSHIICCQSY